MNYYNSETLLEQQQEIQKLKDERDELAAQVEAFGDKLSEVVALLDVDGMTAVQWLLDNCQEIESLTNMEPQQHLRQVRADAAVDFASNLPSLAYMKSEILIEANQYHASILAGKE